jgi:peptidoglycan hydrolase CwlO-like protein
MTTDVTILILLGIIIFQNLILNSKINTIMPTIKELSEKVDELQTSLNDEQEQIRNAIETLQQTVVELQGQLVGGGTDEERQAVLDKINGVITDLKGTIPEEPVPGE